jgi:hypothetical protein
LFLQPSPDLLADIAENYVGSGRLFGPLFSAGRASPDTSFSEIPESTRSFPDSAKLSEKRMHFVREKRDKPPAGAFMPEKD